MKKVTALLLAILLVAVCLPGCASNTNDAPSANTPGQSDPSTPPDSDATPAPSAAPLKVALLLNGTINDGAYNQYMYEALMAAKDIYGIEAAYTESIQVADAVATVQDYLDKGYQFFVVNSDFETAVASVAPDFPDAMFSLMSGTKFYEPNIATYRAYTPHTGFVAGALAAMASESGVVGTIGGMAYPHITDSIAAFEAGAKYINPNCTVLSGYIESWTDAVKAKEMALTFVDQGADVIYSNANTASFGVYEAAEERGDFKCIGAMNDMYDVSPDTMMVSVIQSQYDITMAMIDDAVNGNFKAAASIVGVAENVVRISDWHGHESWITAEEHAKVDEIMAGLADGSLVESGICPKSVYDVD